MQQGVDPVAAFDRLVAMGGTPVLRDGRLRWSGSAALAGEHKALRETVRAGLVEVLGKRGRVIERQGQGRQGERPAGEDAARTAAEPPPAAPWASRVAIADSAGDQAALDVCMAELVAMDQDERQAALRALAAAMPERTGRATVGEGGREGGGDAAQGRQLPLFPTAASPPR